MCMSSSVTSRLVLLGARRAAGEVSIRRLRIETVTIDATKKPAAPRNTPAKDAEIFALVMRRSTRKPGPPCSLHDKGKLGFELKAGKEYDVGAESAESFYDVKRLDLREPRDSNITVSFNLPDTLVLRISFCLMITGTSVRVYHRCPGREASHTKEKLARSRCAIHPKDPARSCTRLSLSAIPIRWVPDDYNTKAWFPPGVANLQ